MEHQFSDTHRGETLPHRQKPLPVPFCPPQIPQELAWCQTWALVLSGWQLMASSIAWQCKALKLLIEPQKE